MKFRKKPVVIEAVQFDKRMDLTSPDWWAAAVQSNQVVLHGMGKMSHDMPCVEIPTLEGVMRGDAGDWIIRGVQGELYPCKPDIFAATYELADTSSGLTFGDALQALKAGKRVARAGWNGKGMFVYYVRAAAYLAQSAAAIEYFGKNAYVPYAPYLALKGVDEKVSTWVPSINDVLAEDWVVLE